MARKTRIFVAGMPYHVIQRGNNKGPIFLCDQDRFYFLKISREAKNKYPCYIYSYCLMDNHFHLLIEPVQENNISLFIKFLGVKYIYYFNKRYGRTGTLWEGRFKCSLIDKDSYFLTCLRYIEMNPLRAGIVDFLQAYRWTSYRSKAYGEKDNILDGDGWYKGLGRTDQERQIKYRNFFENQIPDFELNLIREMTNKNSVLGREDFKKKIAQLTGRTVTVRYSGRPRAGENRV